VRSYRVVVIPGDGIGPEVTAAALAVLDAAQDGFALQIEPHSAGAGRYRETGAAMADTTLAACRSADGVLKGPVGDPAVRHPDGTEAGTLGGILRPGLDAYANVRPVRLYPGVTSALRGIEAGGIDYVIVRENTEGLYASRGKGTVTPDVVTDYMTMSRKGIERVVRKAFALAASRSGAPGEGVRRVTCVDKANVLRGFALFREIFDAVAAEHPAIAADHLYADAAAAALVERPGSFDVLVMENFVGDILSDLGAATVGGLGMCPSGNIGAACAYFEPIHGAAPGLAGTDRANPLATILSGALLLDWLGEAATAARVRAAVERALASRTVSLRHDGTVDQGTRAAATAVIAAL
jgi:isocitrate/isopropylmalate dehydrogenase